MTSRVRVAPTAHAEMTAEAIAVIDRQTFKTRTLRLALGALGLFWVCALIALMR
jgi:hypothetical protein